MGIDLGDVVVRQTSRVVDWSGKRLAFDAWNILYQFVASIRQPDGTPLKDAEGRVTSHLQGILARVGNIVAAGVKPVFVFDGPPHPLKHDTLAKRAARKAEAAQAYEEAIAAGDLETARSKAMQTSRLGPDMVEQAKTLLAHLGVPVLDAPGEGEACAAALARRGAVDGVVSQDFDTLLFGAPVLVRNLSAGGRRKLPGKQVWVDVEPERIPLDASLAAMGVSRPQLIDAAILVGTDFNPGIKGIGAKKAIELVRDAGDLEVLLARAAPGGKAVMRYLHEQQSNLEHRAEVRRLFQADPDPPAIPEARLDAAAARAYLVEGHGFSAARVDAALSKFEAARERASQQSLFDF